MSRYNGEVAAQLTEEIKVVEDALKDIADEEPLYASVPEDYKKAKREKKKKNKSKSKNKQEPRSRFREGSRGTFDPPFQKL